MNDMLAILYDIHGNRPALDAVLADARGRGADRFLLGGDYSAFGGWPVECVELLRDLPEETTWIRGNWERWQADPDAMPGNPIIRGAGGAVREALGPALVAELGDLPTSTVLDGTLFVHASPVSDVEPFGPEPGADDEQKLVGVAQDRVVFGHSHIQFARRSVGGTVELVNPGSVGLPWDGDPRAAYATLDDGDVDLRRVAYDVAAAAAPLDALGAPWAAATAERLRTASFDLA